MQETLYKTKTPKSSVWDGEFYELVLDANRVNGRVTYFVSEVHGWWNDEEKRVVEERNTLSPEEGYSTFDEAHERYNQQRLSRAKGGFAHSFSVNHFGKPYDYEYITSG